MKRLVAVLMIAALVLTLVGCSSAVSLSGAQIDGNGHLILSMSDGSTIDAGMAQGEQGIQGEKGEKGDTGANGINGVDGVGIQKAAVNDNGHLMVRLTDGTLIDTGYVVGASGRDGLNGRDGANGVDGRDGANGSSGINGTDGLTPFIGDNGNWWIGTTDTGVVARGNDFIFDNRGEGTELLAYVGHDANVIIPSKTTVISGGAFSNNQIIQSVTVPEGVTVIQGYAFYKCKSLENVTLPNSLRYIGPYAFAENAIIDADSGTIIAASNLPFTINIPASCTNIGDHAFYWSRISGAIEIHDYVISDYTFYNCRLLTEVRMPNAEFINESAFEFSSVQSAYMPNVRSIGDSAFRYSDLAGSVEVCGSVGATAFECCSDITNITVAFDSENPYFNGIGQGAFCQCNSMQSLSLYALSDGINTINIPSNVYYSSDYNGALSQVVIGSGVALSNKAIYFDNIPITLTLYGNSIQNWNGFRSLQNIAAIYVPATSVDAYKAAAGWSAYASVIQPIPTT